MSYQAERKGSIVGETRKRHGLNALMTRVKVRGLNAIDRRTLAARELLAWRQDLVTALGGQEKISPQKTALVDVVVRIRLYIDHIDGFLMEQKNLVNRKRKTILPILRERQGLVDSLGRLLSLLGLDFHEKPIRTLAQYVAEKEQASGT